jgi:hypothetical protein
MLGDAIADGVAVPGPSGALHGGESFADARSIA